MAKFRVEKSQNFTVMSNYHLRDNSLSLKAKGLLSQMLSLPEDWDYTLQGLSHINREKVDAIRTAVKELEFAGYVIRGKRERSDDGRLGGIEYIIYEEPPNIKDEQNDDEKQSKEHEDETPQECDFDEPILDESTLDEPILDESTLDKPTLDEPTLDKPTLEKPILDYPILEKPTLEKPTLENPMQLNIDIQSKELRNKEKITGCGGRAREKTSGDLEFVMRRYKELMGSLPPAKVNVAVLGYLEYMDKNVVVDSIELAVAENKFSWSYVEAILKRRKKEGVRSMADVAIETDQWERSKKNKESSKVNKSNSSAKKIGPTKEEVEYMNRVSEKLRKQDESEATSEEVQNSFSL